MNLHALIRRVRSVYRRAWHRWRYGIPYEWGQPVGLLHPGYYSFDGGKTWHSYPTPGDALLAYAAFLRARRIEHAEHAEHDEP